MPKVPYLEKLSADPAANNEIVFTADEDMIIMSVHLTLVTDANAANRRVSLFADDGADIFFRVQAAADQAASLTHNYSAFEGAGGRSALTTHLLELPSGGLYQPAGGRLQTTTANRQAGDNFSAAVLAVLRP
jgi:hypothetical protein